MLKMTSTLHTAETEDVLCRRADTMKVKPKYVTDYNIYTRVDYTDYCFS